MDRSSDRFLDEEDDDDDVLRFLDLSNPDMAALPAPYPQIPAVDLSAAGSNSGLPPAFGIAGGGWIPLGAEVDCGNCVVLREVVHSNGLKNLRLCIHGGLCKFYHAMLDVECNADGFPSAMTKSYIDSLSKQSYEWVKQFLIDYGILCLREKYVMMWDSLSSFFDALCARMCSDIATSSSYEDFHFPAEIGLCQSNPNTENDGALRTPKTGIAAQRERTGKLHIKDLACYFHLPISVAAKELHICSTALKKICRRHGMPRWPHRKIKSIDRRISSLLRDLCPGNGQGAVDGQAEIERLRAERARICAGLPP